MHPKTEELTAKVGADMESLRERRDWLKSMIDEAEPRSVTVDAGELYGALLKPLEEKIEAYEVLLEYADELFELRDYYRAVSQKIPSILELAGQVREEAAGAISRDASEEPEGLLKLAMEIQEEFWNGAKKPPKQDFLVAEIMRRYGVSEIKAKAIEAVACPIDRAKRSS
ncbi:hypothetical protein NFI08_06995 [Halomonas sp. EF61]|uniref:hypothetical protein n=1 Tax=Halomonas sp. EF61 TaxID=2950869 RepID=UPI0032DFB0C2